MKFEDLIITEGNNHSETGYFHFEVKDNFPKSRGHGTDSNKNTALTKSLHEYIERLYFNEYFHTKVSQSEPLTSNGFACHLTNEMAVKSAECELFERDILISHWIEKIPSYWLFNSDLNKYTSKEIVNTLEKLLKLGFDFQIGIMAEVNKNIVMVGKIKLTNPLCGYVIVSACDESIQKTIPKIVNDFIRVADLLLGRLKNNLNLFKKLDESQVVRPEDHLEFYLNPTNWENNSWFLESANEIKSYQFNSSEFRSQKSSKILSWTHYIVQSQNNQLQQLFFGKTNENKINFKRIQKILNWGLHPLA